MSSPNPMSAWCPAAGNRSRVLKHGEHLRRRDHGHLAGPRLADASQHANHVSHLCPERSLSFISQAWSSTRYARWRTRNGRFHDFMRVYAELVRSLSPVSSEQTVDPAHRRRVPAGSPRSGLSARLDKYR